MIKNDIPRLSGKPPAENALPAPQTPPAIRAKTGLSDSKAGIASPLSESDYDARAWHPEKTLVSTDGIFTFKVRFLQSIALTDANGRDVVMEFQDKP